jgi:hypothetical protein
MAREMEAQQDVLVEATQVAHPGLGSYYNDRSPCHDSEEKDEEENTNRDASPGPDGRRRRNFWPPLLERPPRWNVSNIPSLSELSQMPVSLSETHDLDVFGAAMPLIELQFSRR